MQGPPVRNRGVRRPGVGVAICAVMAAFGLVSVLWGVGEMRALERETSATAFAIGLGLLTGLTGFLFFFLFLFNFLWASRLIGALRRGEGVIARWTVAPATFEMFRDREDRLRAAGDDNDYRLPRQVPHAGLEVIVSEDGVLIGDTSFGLASAGLARFREVRIEQGSPPCLAFDTVVTTASNVSVVRVHHIPGVLRVPIAHDGQDAAARVLAHYRAVIARRTIVKPDFWRRRVRWGLIAALISALIAAAGFALAAGTGDFGLASLVMVVGGLIMAAGGLILALLAALVGRFHRHG